MTNHFRYNDVPVPMEVDCDEVIKPIKPYRKKAIPKTVKMQCWSHYFGNEKGKAKCMCCNSTDIFQANFEAGHVISERHGGETNIENLRPICSLCNRSMGMKNMIEFMKQYGYKFTKNWYGKNIILIE